MRSTPVEGEAGGDIGGELGGEAVVVVKFEFESACMRNRAREAGEGRRWPLLDGRETRGETLVFEAGIWSTEDVVGVIGSREAVLVNAAADR